MPVFTPTQQKMLVMLADGKPHTQAELSSCLWDDMGDPGNVKNHIHAIRKKLRPIGQDIITSLGKHFVISYIQVRLLASAYDGKK